MPLTLDDLKKEEGEENTWKAKEGQRRAITMGRLGVREEGSLT
jgi:hypothetical protein